MRTVNFFQHSVAYILTGRAICVILGAKVSFFLVLIFLLSQADGLIRVPNVYPLEVRPGHNGVIGLLFCYGDYE